MLSALLKSFGIDEKDVKEAIANYNAAAKRAEETNRLLTDILEELKKNGKA